MKLLFLFTSVMSDIISDRVCFVLKSARWQRPWNVVYACEPLNKELKRAFSGQPLYWRFLKSLKCFSPAAILCNCLIESPPMLKINTQHNIGYSLSFCYSVCHSGLWRMDVCFRRPLIWLPIIWFHSWKLDRGCNSIRVTLSRVGLALPDQSRCIPWSSWKTGSFSQRL